LKPTELSRLHVGMSRLTDELRERGALEHELFATATGVLARFCREARKGPQRSAPAAPVRRKAVR
jgi:hypothetical protein